MVKFQKLKKAPLAESLLCAVVIASNLIIAPKTKVAVDALFLEGMPIAIAGAVFTLGRGTRSPFGIGRRVPALRMFFVGIVLVAASVVVGELLRLR